MGREKKRIKIVRKIFLNIWLGSLTVNNRRANVVQKDFPKVRTRRHSFPHRATEHLAKLRHWLEREGATLNDLRRHVELSRHFSLLAWHLTWSIL